MKKSKNIKDQPKCLILARVGLFRSNMKDLRSKEFRLK